MGLLNRASCKSYILLIKVVLAGFSIVFFSFGCAYKPSQDSFDYVANRIEENIGSAISTESTNKIPPEISLDDGLSEKDAIAIALWNNAAFHADLAQLGVSRAEVLKAGLIKNPNFSLLFPIGVKQLEAWMFWSLSELQVRPHRLALAKLKEDRVADNLIKNGLDLARDTQIAFSKLLHAQNRLSLLKKKAALTTKISGINLARLGLGDISELETQSSKMEVLDTSVQINKLNHEEKLYRHRLLSLMGMNPKEEFELLPTEPDSNPKKDIFSLLKMAFASRPELRIAELEIESAGKRIGWEQSKIFNFIVILDANETNQEVGPGISFDLPVFNQNQGGIARAKAQLDVATKKYIATREKIQLGVKESHTRYMSALKKVQLVNEKILPQMDQALSLSNQALENGDVSYLSHLRIKQELVQAQLRQANARAELWIETAKLGHSIGRPIELLKPRSL